MVGLSGLPIGFTLCEFRLGQFYVKCSDLGVDFDDVAVPQQRDRTTHSRFRPDMADAETSGSPGKAAIGDERDLAAHALPGQRRRGREHLPHAGTAARALIADDDDLTLFVGFLLDRLEGVPSRSKQRAGPVNFRLDIPATFTIAPSGARFPFRPTTPPVTVIGLSADRTTSWCGFHFTLLRFSAIVRPVTVRQSPCRWPLSSNVFIKSGMPPASNISLAT